MAEKTYPEIVDECAITRVDLDTVLHPTFSGLKEAFVLLFKRYGYDKADFKRLSDAVYYQGGYPSENSPAKEFAWAQQISQLLRLESLIGRTELKKYFEDFGVNVTFTDNFVAKNFLSEFTPDEDKEFQNALSKAGVTEVDDDRVEMLQILVNRAQELQAEICQTADTIKVDAAAVVEAQHGIKKGNFVKTVGLAATKKRRGEGPMLEKLESIEDNMSNMTEALKPLKK